jgi:glycosyltransferase involved in cell wall biosynthesis
MNTIYYWSPFTSKVATVKSVINSAYAVNRYLKKEYQAIILDAVNEWKEYSQELDKKNIKLENLNKDLTISFFKKQGFLRARLIYLYIFFKSFLPLHNLLKKKKPKYLIVHLITSLPLLLFKLNNYETKLILRISGLPKMTFIRKIIWKFSSQKIYKITCPTEDTYKDLSKFSFLKDKLLVLKDPVINCLETQIIKSKNVILPRNTEAIINKKDFFLSIGRFTKQKNFIFYLNCIPEILKINKNLYFLFIGSGEDENFFLKNARKLDIIDRIILIKKTDNVHFFMKKSKCFILTSLWEDPGFVLIEAGYNNCQIISSDCPNGPKEIIKDDGGYLFKNNDPKSLVETVRLFLGDSETNKLKKKIKVKKRLKSFTIFQHSVILKSILE